MSTRDKMTGKDSVNARYFTVYRLLVKRDYEVDGNPWMEWDTSGDRAKLLNMARDLEPGTQWQLQADLKNGWETIAHGTAGLAR